jgi:AraC family transcriptional regulator, dual regulator of chb operon
MMQFPRYHFAQIAPGAAFHAAHATFPAEGLTEVRHHCHDFFEWIVVIKGTARHWINGEWSVLQKDHLALIRPNDAHAILPRNGESIELVNIAFPVKVWDDFVTATGLQDAARIWAYSTDAICISLLEDQSRRLQQEALTAFRSYHQGPTRLAFSSFWSAAAGTLLGSSNGLGDRSIQPLWLRSAIAWSEHCDPAELTLDALVEAAGVSGAHLSRSMKTHMGTTPTQFITNLRLKKAAYEIATTDHDLAGIAFDCGFGSLSYFYRRFQSFYAKTPKRYRQDARGTFLS